MKPHLLMRDCRGFSLLLYEKNHEFLRKQGLRYKISYLIRQPLVTEKRAHESQAEAQTEEKMPARPWQRTSERLTYPPRRNRVYGERASQSTVDRFQQTRSPHKVFGIRGLAPK